MRQEISRKAIHLGMAVIPLASVFVARPLLLQGIGVLLVIALSIELGRHHLPGVNQRFQALFGPMLRDSESRKMTGATYLLLASFISFWLYELWIAQVVILFVVISDGLSALLGKWLGKHAFYGNKTWEGNAVFLLTAFFIVYLHPHCPLGVGLLGMTAAFLADVLILKYDDNLTIPLVSGVIMQLVTWVRV